MNAWPVEKMERYQYQYWYAKLPQRPKTITTGLPLGSIKTAWIRVHSASNRLLGLENGWPFRRLGGGAAQLCYAAQRYCL